MSDTQTSAQYGLGVDIGRLLVKALEDGMTYDEAIETLANATAITVRNKAFGITFAPKVAA